MGSSLGFFFPGSKSGEQLQAEWQAAAVLHVAQLPKLPSSIPDWCLERLSSGSALDSRTYAFSPESCSVKRYCRLRDPGIVSDVALLGFITRYALYFPPLSVRQQLPRLGQLGFPSKLLRRFLRGCVVATAHGLVTAPASVYVDAMTKMIWRNRIFARTMSGFVMREVVRLQAAAAARIAGRYSVVHAASNGYLAEVLSFLIADPNCVNKHDMCRQEIALHCAALVGYTAVCRLLIVGKADVNATDCYGQTPLKVAIRSGYIINSNHNKYDVVALLRSLGAAE